MTKIQTKPLVVREGRTELDTNYNGKTLTFVAPS